MIVPVKELSEMTARANPSLYVMLTAWPDRLRISGAQEESWVHSILTVETDGAAEAVMFVESWTAALKAFPVDELIDLQFEGEKMRLIGPGQNVAVETVARPDMTMPTSIAEDVTAWSPQLHEPLGLVVDAGPFATWVEFATQAASTDKARPTLTKTVLRTHGSSIEMATTDGYRLAIAHVTKMVPKDHEPVSGDVVLDTGTLRRAAAAARRLDAGKSVWIFVNGHDIVVNVGGLDEFGCAKTDVRYPDYTAIVPDPTLATTKVDNLHHEVLAPAFKTAAPMANTATNAVELEVIPAPEKELMGEFVVQSANSSYGSVRTGYKMTAYDISGQPIKTSFNVKYLIAALPLAKRASGSTMLMTQSTRPLLWQFDLTEHGVADSQLIIMPMWTK